MQLSLSPECMSSCDICHSCGSAPRAHGRKRTRTDRSMKNLFGIFDG